MIDWDIEEVVFIIEIIDLNNKIFIEKTMMILIFKIINNNIYIRITLINQDITVLL